MGVSEGGRAGGGGHHSQHDSVDGKHCPGSEYIYYMTNQQEDYLCLSFIENYLRFPTCQTASQAWISLQDNDSIIRSHLLFNNTMSHIMPQIGGSTQENSRLYQSQRMILGVWNCPWQNLSSHHLRGAEIKFHTGETLTTAESSVMLRPLVSEGTGDSAGKALPSQTLSDPRPQRHSPQSLKPRKCMSHEMTEEELPENSTNKTTVSR